MSGYGALDDDRRKPGPEHKHTPPYAQGAHEHDSGAPFGLSTKMSFFGRHSSTMRTTRKRLNCVAPMVNIVLPWFVFAGVFALVSFSTHYHSPVLCYAIVAAIFVIVVGSTGLLAFMTRLKEEKEADDVYVPMWYGFLCSTCFLAIVVAVILGNVNFGSRMQEFYNLQGLATYRDINPSQYVGQQLVDAGRVLFQDNAYVDVGKSMAFKDIDTYCVAPMVSPSTTPSTYLDFWVVGKNCCSGNQQTGFHCKGALDSRYKGGLRLMNDADRPFYRLAVQQAEATYKVSTHKPLFFTLDTDPIEYSKELLHHSVQMYFMGIAAAFVIQLFAVVVATFYFAKVLPNRST